MELCTTSSATTSNILPGRHLATTPRLLSAPLQIVLPITGQIAPLAIVTSLSLHALPGVVATVLAHVLQDLLVVCCVRRVITTAARSASSVCPPCRLLVQCLLAPDPERAICHLHLHCGLWGLEFICVLRSKWRIGLVGPQPLPTCFSG